MFKVEPGNGIPPEAREKPTKRGGRSPGASGQVARATSTTKSRGRRLMLLLLFNGLADYVFPKGKKCIPPNQDSGCVN